jgi:hypothetical protein
VSTASGANGEARVVAQSADGLRDTARVFVGSTPSGVRVTPGVVSLAAGGTQQLTGEVLDGGGNVLSGFAVAWVSRDPAVATVDNAGLASAVATGAATVVASSGALADSTRLLVVPAGNVAAGTISNGRFFRAVRVGDTVLVDIVADMRFTGGEALGSYNADLTWTPGTLQYLTTETGTFGTPTVNASGAAQGQLRIGHANAQGGTGLVVLARVRFRAQAGGSGNVALTFSEMSAAGTFTNLISRITVAAGAVTVVP